jgi:predicted TPR repeat methyltransferase
MDYRQSHLFKGSSYDRALAEAPFDAFMSQREDEVLQRVVPRLFPNGVGRYLDFACGTGRALTTVSQFAKETYGVDISPSMLSQARAKCPEATLIHADLTVDDRDLGTFDLITAFRFFGNAQDSLRRGALAAITRRLSPAGYLVFDSHRNPWSLRSLLHPVSREPMDLHYGRLSALLRSHGLEIVERYGIGWWIVLDRQHQKQVLFSKLANVLESVPVGRTPLAWICPDAVVVARKSS